MMHERKRPAPTRGSTEAITADELLRLHELLDPLIALTPEGPDRLPDDERDPWQTAIEALLAGVEHPLEAEETIATFARVLWAAPAWADPAANIATALLARVLTWPEPSLGDGLDLARSFADRAISLDPSSLPARAALARIAVASGDVAGAEKVAARLPSGDTITLSVRSEIRAARGDLHQAIALRETQLASEQRPAERRAAGLHLARLLEQDGQTARAIATYRVVIAASPDLAPVRAALAKLLRRSAHLLDAFSEAEAALLLGGEEGRDLVADIAVELDQQSLDRFRHALRTARDSDTMTWCPSVAAPT